LDPPENWNITVFRGVLLTFDLMEMVTDVEGDPITFSLDPISDHVTITDGELAILYPEDTEATLFTVQITADDGNGGSDTASLRILIDHGEAPQDEDWDLYRAVVEIDEEGDWYIEVQGMPGIDVYFIIEEDGERTAYRMDEDIEYPGNYTLDIQNDEFDEGEIYTYFFTNATDGEWLEPEFSGTEVQPGKEVENVVSIWAVIAGVICVSIIVLMILILLVVLVVRRSSKGEGIEE
jgi:hypothetical protein